ncbi:unnamed protein product [Leptosia nina]|uniref:Uncharacterized protein n=1 Tax=Leptosia nina TaxID=320188 RepID=A0AAV1K543_9NEOP
MGRRRQRCRFCGVVRRARAGRAGGPGRLGRIFCGAGGRGRRADRDQPQQRHTPPPEHGGQRAGNVPYAARGPFATEVRTPWSRSSLLLAISDSACRGAGGRWYATRERARGHTATAALFPIAYDRTRTLFRERRSAPLLPPARRALPILREIAGGR